MAVVVSDSVDIVESFDVHMAWQHGSSVEQNI